jgi:hypothetical protein
MKFAIQYTERYVTVIEANSEDEAREQFENGDFEQGKYVEGTTEIVDVELPI